MACKQRRRRDQVSINMARSPDDETKETSSRHPHVLLLLTCLPGHIAGLTDDTLFAHFVNNSTPHSSSEIHTVCVKDGTATLLLETLLKLMNASI